MDVVPIPATLEVLPVKALAEPIAVPMHVGQARVLAAPPLVPPPPPLQSDAVLTGKSSLMDGEAKRAKMQDDNQQLQTAGSSSLVGNRGSKKDSNPETKGKRTLYMRAEWPGLIFYRDCTFATTARKLQAKAIWDTVKRRTEAPKSEEEVTCVWGPPPPPGGRGGRARAAHET